jgi:hypothetical protein
MPVDAGLGAFDKGAPKRPNGPADADALLPYLSGEDYRELPPRELVIKGLFGVGELSVLYGPPKSGKSFLATDAGLAIAAGHPLWFGHKIKRRGLAFYVVAEGAGGFGNRLAAWSQTNDRPVPTTFAWATARLRFLTEPVRNAAAEDVHRLMAAIVDAETAAAAPCVAVIIDTAARAMTGGDENSAQDMGRFLDQCSLLQTIRSRPHVVVVHHDNAAGTKARGSTALPAAADTLLRIERGDEGRAWSVDWAKDAHDDRQFGFRLEQVALGRDDDGDPVTSCVVRESEAPARAAATRDGYLGERQRVFMRALTRLGRRPGGVDRAVLRSAFICDLNAERERDGQAPLTAEQSATAFRRMVHDLGQRRPAPFVEDGEFFRLSSRSDA